LTCAKYIFRVKKYIKLLHVTNRILHDFDQNGDVFAEQDNASIEKEGSQLMPVYA
jgi:hypothetical protein